MADEYEITANPLSASGLLETVLGKQADTNIASTQATTGSTTQALTGTTNQATTGNTAQNTTGSTSQSTVGTTRNLGSQTQNQTVQGTADTAALREVFAKQSQGITPEMLAAIFQQGVKQAPNLVTAQAGALGARGVGNSPMAQVLNQLNGDLTSKAADINRQLLADSGITAANIAANTRGSTTSGVTTDDTVNSQNQGVTTANNQVVDTAQNQNVVGSNTQNVAGTQAQNVVANEQKKQATTINTSIAKKLAGLAAAGVGINELFKIATGQGFVGNVKDLIAYMQGSFGTGIIDNAGNWTGNLGSTGLSDTGSLLDSLTNTDWSSGNTGLFDNGLFSGGFADGGMPAAEFLSIAPLIKKQTVIGNPDADLNGLLQAMGGSEKPASVGGGSSAGASSGSDAGGSGGASDAGGASTSGGMSSNGSPATAAQNAALGSVVGAVMGMVSGNPIGIAKGVVSIANVINNALDADANAEAQAGLSAVNDSVGSAMGEGVAGGGGIGDSVGVGADGTDAGAGGSGSNGGNGDGGSSGGDGGGSADGSAYADGGLPSEADPVMDALGIAVQSNSKMTKLLYDTISGKSKQKQALANGGKVKGPGTGTSDSVPANTPTGPIRVSNGEYIIPADVVQKFGANAFDKLVQQHHVPAEMQEAITGAKNGGLYH